ncbi:Macrophage erythroblast attacher [Porphyridium purpureum]|uniref:Macrophage erythroblast attacher n=1 Tax=Porphyridium purpureum TaxID=35688 RepID=A0A5J4YRI5_PORPP|nr:Macrophage erythroblast attacher [Porphyridium purpureum]KAA8499418.1 Macrophage erythroblast attacher [Porphyridium purpureum]|eukprot:POR7094..scf295_1
MELEYAVLKVPSEALMKHFRASKKAVDKEVESCVALMNEYNAALSASTWPTAGSSQQHQLLKDRLDKQIARLKTLKKKWVVLCQAEQKALDVLRVRVQYVKRYFEIVEGYEENGTNDGTGAASAGEEMSDKGACDPSTKALRLLQWQKTRLYRILVDHILREGLYSSAQKLAKEAGVENLVDVDVFLTRAKVIESLGAGDCTEAFKWCVENKRRLAKINSTFEFRLRLQEFVELRRAGKIAEATQYARKHLSVGMTMSQDGMTTQFQTVMALLAFEPDTRCEPYASLYAKERWKDLIAIFKNDSYMLHGLTHESLLSILIKAGVSSLKTRFCFAHDADGDTFEYNVNCPTCNEPFQSLARDLPFSHHVHSVLVCKITGKLMNEHNAPIVLPNGNVYSESALESMAKESGMVFDPRTREHFVYPPSNPNDPAAEFKRVFIM